MNYPSAGIAQSTYAAPTHGAWEQPLASPIGRGAQSELGAAAKHGVARLSSSRDSGTFGDARIWLFVAGYERHWHHPFTEPAIAR